ncbi:MAG: ATP-binding protein [Candidatus Omnitrophota bacterium]
MPFVFSCVCPAASSKVYAQSIPPAALPAVTGLPEPGRMVTTSPAYHPAVIKGIKLFPDNPLKFDFFIDTGDSNLKHNALKQETSKLVKYFLASLTVPEEDMWVNLSPYEKDRIIPAGFGKTEMGRDLLAQDYILKQITASLMYPEDELGKNFWDTVRRRAREEYGVTEIPVETFNKVWIVPEKAIVYESGDVVLVAESRLKVMLDSDYEAMQQKGAQEPKSPGSQVKDFTWAHGNVGSWELDSGELSKEVIREVILPQIEKEVNEGKNFAPLRQIYDAMILATWFKRNLKEGLLGNVYVDQNKVNGINLHDEAINQKIYAQYLEAFKRGVYNYIKEDYDADTQTVIPRKYFSGGVVLGPGEAYGETSTSARVIPDGAMITTTVELNPQVSKQAANVVPQTPEEWMAQTWMKSFKDRFPKTGFLKSLEEFIRFSLDEPFVFDVIQELNTLPNEAVLENVVRRIRNKENRKDLPESGATVRGSFFAITMGSIQTDPAQMLRGLGGITTKKGLQNYLEILGEDQTKEAITRYYLILRAWQIVYQNGDMVFKKEDAQEGSELLNIFLKKELLYEMGGNRMYDMSSDYAERLMSFSTMLLEQLLGRDPRVKDFKLNQKELIDALSKQENAAIRESIENYLRFLEVLMKKAPESWGRALTQQIPEENKDAAKYRSQLVYLAGAVDSFYPSRMREREEMNSFVHDLGNFLHRNIGDFYRLSRLLSKGGVATEVFDEADSLSESIGEEFHKMIFTIREGLPFQDVKQKVVGDFIRESLPLVERLELIFNDAPDSFLILRKRIHLTREYLELGLNATRIEHYALSDVIQDMVDVFASSGIHVKTDIAEDIPRLYGYRWKMTRVMQNLIVNAIDAMPEGGDITITARMKDFEDVEIKVADTGEGIQEDQLPHIFDPYYTTKGSKGTGLGLAIVKKFVEHNDGTISVESEAGKGTVFTITLPKTIRTDFTTSVEKADSPAKDGAMMTTAAGVDTPQWIHDFLPLGRQDAPRRLTVQQARELLRHYMLSIQRNHEELIQLADEVQQAVAARQSKTVLKDKLKETLEKFDEFHDILQDVYNLEPLVGFLDEEAMTRTVKNFAGHLQEVLGVDKVAVRFGLQTFFTSSVGFSESELLSLGQRMDDILDDKNQGKEFNLPGVEGRFLTRHEFSESWGQKVLVIVERDKNKDPFTDQDIRSFHHEIKDNMKKLEAVFQQLEDLGYQDFSMFMGSIRHNSSIGQRKNLWASSRLVNERLLAEEDETSQEEFNRIIMFFSGELKKDFEEYTIVGSSFIRILESGTVFKNRVDVARILQQRLDLYRQKVEDRGLTWKVSVPAEPLMADHIDQAYLELVVDNLIDNAVKYTEKGFIELRMRKGKYTSDFRSRLKNKEMILIEVADSGIGIPAEEKFLVTRAGFRGANVGEVKGTGFGLNFASNAVAAMRGDHQIISEAGKGTTIRIALHPSKDGGNSSAAHINKDSAMLSTKAGSFKHLAKEGRKRLCSILRNPADFDWESNKGLLPSLKGLPLGNTRKRGNITLCPYPGYVFQFSILGFHEAGWRVLVIDDGVRNGIYEFTVELTKEARDPVQRTFQVGRYTRTANGIGSNKGSSKEILDVDSRLGLRALTGLVTMNKDTDWDKQANDLPDLTGYQLGVTNANAMLSFSPYPYYLYPWPALGFYEEGWNAVIANSGVNHGWYEFTVKFTKDGRAPFYKTFQIGPEIKKLNRVGKDSWHFPKKDVLEINDRAGLKVIIDLINKGKNFDWTGATNLPKLAGLRLGELDSEGKLIFSPQTWYRYTWSVLGFYEDGWEGVVVEGGVKGDVYEFKVELTKEGRPPLNRVFQIGPYTRKLKHIRDPQNTLEVLDINARAGLKSLATLVTMPKGYDWVLNAEKLPKLKGLLFGKTTVDGILFFCPFPHYFYQWRLGLKGEWNARVTDVAAMNNVYEFIVELTKGNKKFLRTFQIGDAARMLRNVANGSEKIKEVLAISESLGAQVMKKFVMLPPDFDWTANAKALPDLSGLYLGSTDLHGVIRFALSDNYYYYWPVLGFSEKGWKAMIKATWVQDGVFNIVVELTKEGREPVLRVFQMGAFTKIIRGQGAELGKKMVALDINPRLGLRAINDFILSDKNFDWQKNAKSLPSVKGLRVGTTNKLGNIVFAPVKYTPYYWPVLGFCEEGWEVVIVDGGVVDGVYEFTVKLSKAEREPITRTFRIGKYTKHIRKQTTDGRNLAKKEVMAILDAEVIEGFFRKQEVIPVRQKYRDENRLEFREVQGSIEDLVARKQIFATIGGIINGMDEDEKEIASWIMEGAYDEAIQEETGYSAEKIQTVRQTLQKGLLKFYQDYLDRGLAEDGGVSKKGEDGVGGIDLNPNRFDLQMQGPGMDVDLPASMPMFENMTIDGFIPVIINITPTSDLSFLSVENSEP